MNAVTESRSATDRGHWNAPLTLEGRLRLCLRSRPNHSRTSRSSSPSNTSRNQGPETPHLADPIAILLGELTGITESSTYRIRPDFPPTEDPAGQMWGYAARVRSRRARWLVRVWSSGWPFHQASSRIRLSATAE